LYHAPAFETDEHETRWMIRITVNLAKNHLKRFWGRNRTNIDDLSEFPEMQQWQWNEKDRDVFFG
jgi:hypothetical protein